MNEVNIGGVPVGPNSRPFVIAEMSGNHNGSLKRALEIVEQAAFAGASAIKLQTYKPDTITLNSDNDEFLIKDPNSLWFGRNLFELYSEAHTPWEWHPAIFEAARKLGIVCFSSPFDETAVDFLEELETPAYKIASFEIVHLPLISKVASTGKPLIISTGLATIEEIEAAVDVAQRAGNNQLILLKCTSAYPTQPIDCNLSTIPDIRERFNTQVGFSDHTLGVSVSSQAVKYYGATVIEKHFTLAETQSGVDEAFSLGPEELKSLVLACNSAHENPSNSSENSGSEAHGVPTYGGTENEKESLIFRPSIWFTRSLSEGTTVTKDDLIIRRPSYGLPPRDLDNLIGQKLSQTVNFADPTSWELFH